MTDTAELYRLLANLIRIGQIIAVDLTQRPALVRVASGDLETNWLQWCERRAGTTTTWSPPTVGEQVLMLCPEGDTAAAIVVSGLNSDANPAPSASPDEWKIRFPDGATVTYNHATGDLLLTGMQTATVEAARSMTVRCPDILLDGKVTVTDLFSYQAGMSGMNGRGNSTAITGDLTHRDGRLSSNGVVLDQHNHDGVQRGGSSTDGPNKS
ncbi:phage baseplate assembly protein V [Bordetella sp. 2513F-2]